MAPHHRALHAHCYRILGSTQDAEDALQETLVRAWRGLGGFEGRSPLRSWLYTIATNTSLRLLERRPARALPLDEPGADDVLWLEPYPDREPAEDEAVGPHARYERRESLELALVAALQHVAPRQRAVLVLRDVLGFSAAEVAAILDLSVPSANSLLQRARRTVDERLPARSQHATLAALGDARVQALVSRYVAAMDDGDVDALVAMLTADATFTMPPEPAVYRGEGAIAGFLREGPMNGRIRWRHVPARANGHAAAAAYMWQEDAYVLYALDVLTFAGDRLAAVTAFLDPAALARLDLPTRLEA